jgi:hypothetical protein
MVIGRIDAVFSDEPETGFYTQFIECLKDGMQGKADGQRFWDGGNYAFPRWHISPTTSTARFFAMAWMTHQQRTNGSTCGQTLTFWMDSPVPMRYSDRKNM